MRQRLFIKQRVFMGQYKAQWFCISVHRLTIKSLHTDLSTRNLKKA